MMKKDDDFPSDSDDPELKPPVAQSIGKKNEHQEEQEFRILLRFLIGSAVVGNEEFWRRARLWQAEVDKARSFGTSTSPADETETTRLRYALLGLFFQALDGSSSRLKSIGRSSGRAYQTVTRLVNPVTSSRLLRPVRHTFDHVVSKGESVLESWIQTGRREELLSRSLVLDEAYEGLVNDALDYVAQKPEIRDLVQDQGVGMAEEIVGELRARSTDVDSYLANKANAIFRRQREAAQPTLPVNVS
jgi:hypothetical protein